MGEGAGSRQRANGEAVHNLEDCFVNINAADFGIEVDKIARITLNKRLVLCDGEVTAHRALNRPVGLFEVSRPQNDLAAGHTSFEPDRFYYGGTPRSGRDIGGFLDRVLLPEIKGWRSKRDVERFKRTRGAERLRLCPVTESIIRRHMQLAERASTPPVSAYVVFLSYASPDQLLAKRVFTWLHHRGLRVFFAPRNLARGTWNRAIYTALSSARSFVSVSTQLEYRNRSWPKWEIDAFHMMHLDQVDKSQAKIVPFVKNIDPASLPLPLRTYQPIDFSKQSLHQGLEQLVERIQL